MRLITIHKPTHKFFAAPGELAIGLGQLRGSLLYLNRLEHGRVIERSFAIQTGAEHLTGYGDGVPMTDSAAIQSMRGAWRHVFGYDCPAPIMCERAL